MIYLILLERIHNLESLIVLKEIDISLSIHVVFTSTPRLSKYIIFHKHRKMSSGYCMLDKLSRSWWTSDILTGKTLLLYQTTHTFFRPEKLSSSLRSAQSSLSRYTPKNFYHPNQLNIRYIFKSFNSWLTLLFGDIMQTRWYQEPTVTCN